MTKFSFIAIFSLNLISSFSNATPFSSSVSNDLRMSIYHNQTAKSFAEWNASGITFQDLFKSFRNRNLNSAELTQLCQALLSLENKKLALLQEEIENPLNTQLIEKCHTPLIAQLETYWLNQKARMQFKSLKRSVLAKTNHLSNQAQSNEMTAILQSETGATQQFQMRSKSIDTENGPVLVSGGLAVGEFALTFDDGPHPQRTNSILSTLKKFGVKAHFFSLGENVKRYPQITQAAAAAGHRIGSHSFTHPDLARLDEEDALYEIQSAHNLIYELLGFVDPFFRFPYGSRTPELQSRVQALKLATFFWNIDTLDWKTPDPEELAENTLALMRSQKKGIILFHDIKQQTTLALPLVLEKMLEENLNLVQFAPMNSH